MTRYDFLLDYAEEKVLAEKKNNDSDSDSLSLSSLEDKQSGTEKTQVKKKKKTLKKEESTRGQKVSPMAVKMKCLKMDHKNIGTHLVIAEM